MKNELASIELAALKRMYESATFKMEQSLINGAAWSEVREQKELVVRLAAAIHQKQPSYFFHPAEASSNRNREGNK